MERDLQSMSGLGAGGRGVPQFQIPELTKLHSKKDAMIGFTEPVQPGRRPNSQGGGLATPPHLGVWAGGGPQPGRWGGGIESGPRSNSWAGAVPFRGTQRASQLPPVAQVQLQDSSSHPATARALGFDGWFASHTRSVERRQPGRVATIATSHMASMVWTAAKPAAARPRLARRSG